MKTYHQSQQEKYKRERGQVQEAPTQTPLAMGVEALESVVIKSLILMKKIFKRKDNR